MFSTRQAAKRLGLGAKTLSHYIAVGKVPAPQILKVGSASLHAWTEEDIENVRKLLPKIANGRKTRYKKKSGVRSQESEEPKNKNRKSTQKSGDRSQKSEEPKNKSRRSIQKSEVRSQESGVRKTKGKSKIKGKISAAESGPRPAGVFDGATQATP